MTGGYIDGSVSAQVSLHIKLHQYYLLAGTFIFGWVCWYADQQMGWQISVHVKPGEKHTQTEPVDWGKGKSANI